MSNAEILWYQQPARNFNEALPLGNGRMGAMFYGGVEQDKISLNEDTLWTGWPRASGMECAEVYGELQRLVLEGKTAEAEHLFESAFSDFLVQQYLPLGELLLAFDHAGEPSDYRRSLCLSQAIGQVSYRVCGCRYSREYLISRDHSVLAVQLSADRPGQLQFSLSLKGKLQCDFFTEGNSLYLDGSCPIALAEYGDMYRDASYHHYGRDESQKGVLYRAGVTVRAEGGTVCVRAGMIQVAGADRATVYFAVRTSFNGPLKHPALEGKPYREICVQDLERAAAAGFEAIREQSIAQHREQFSRANITLFDGKNSGLPTDRRMQLHAAGEEDPSLYTLLFNYGKYLTIAASQKGTRAMNLQGIWNEKLLPPWSCNYTLNINTEMNYWPTLQLGLFECYEPLVELVKCLHLNGRDTARRFYGKGGFVSHHATDMWGLSHPISNHLPGSTQWGFWNMSSGWLSRMLYDYYEFTGDRAYLDAIWPVLSDSARFYREMLMELDGELILCPSTSPENNYLLDGAKTAVDKTAAMTMQIIRDVFTCCIQAGEQLGAEVSQYRDLLPRLKTDFLSQDGSLNEWYEAREQWEVHHRHLSHLYGLFPARLFDDGEKEAAKKVLQQRGDGGTGWSLAWKINLWARLKDGERAKKLLDMQLSPVDSSVDDASCAGGSYPNLFCAHPPFQIDGNFGACSGMIQMLLQVDENGQPVLLPALPESWHSGSVENLHLPGGRTVSFRWEAGKIVSQHVEFA